MRLEAFAHGLPVDMVQLDAVKDCTFLKDIKVLCEDVEQCPCYARLDTLYRKTHSLLRVFLNEGKPAKQKASAVLDLVAQINLILEAFDALELWIETRDEEKAQRVIAEQKTSAEEVLDTLEKSTQELDELLQKQAASATPPTS